MSALYIHIPFCKTRCNYCDFYKSTSCDNVERYVEALFREMDYQRDFLRMHPVKTLYFGGGTPSLLAPAYLQRIKERAAEMWDLTQLEEVTVEINPDDATDEYLDDLSRIGVNRISFGVQSFIDRDLRFMGRRHTAAQAVDAIGRARNRGFDNISVDLIFGIPGMSLMEWEGNILKALMLGVQHISAYHLTIADDTVFGRMAASGELVPVDEEVSEEQYMRCHQMLTEVGFEHYEISNYALGRQRRSQHNMSYWNGDLYLGLGPSAHSYTGSKRIMVVNDLEKYIAGAGTRNIYGTELLSSSDTYNEFIMTSLRTSDGIQRDRMAAKFGFKGLLYFEYTAERLVDEGLLVMEDNAYKIPPEKFIISNSIISDLFYIEA